MPEKLVWAVRSIPLDSEDPYIETGDWEPFGVTMDDDLMLRKQVFVEDEKSSVHHEMSFSQRYGDPED